MDNRDVEELSKKSFEVVVHLSAKEMSTTSSDSDLSDDEDQGGRPVCNVWKGKNHELQAVGKFDSDFLKRLKHYTVPETVPIRMDTFARVESNYPCDDPLIDEAFLLFERPRFGTLLEPKLNAKQDENSPNDDDESVVNSCNEENDMSDQSGVDNLEDTFSETEQEIGEFIASLKIKRLQGDNVTGEILVFDEDYDVVRNLHSDSISLTTYGGISDGKIFGKTEILFDNLSSEEKCLLKVIEPEVDKGLTYEEVRFVQGISNQAEKGSGDFSISNKV